ncbi:MAG TPA: GntR family transcriptional regulator [Gaiellaceae bacterium]|nr:GntR family transcriptional regulator [Gaiellaceae bacterium]
MTSGGSAFGSRGGGASAAAARSTLFEGHPSYTILSAPRQVAAAIKREILQGTLKPGDRLPSEEQLAELFGVSRPTVRAALQELASAGAVVARRGRGGGYRVSALSLDTLTPAFTELIALSLVVESLTPAQFLEVRRELELLSADAAARRRTEQHLERLERMDREIAAIVSGAAPQDPREAFEMDLEFHRVLAEAADNPLLVSLEGAMIVVLHHLFGSGESIPPSRALGDVRDVIDAVRRRDPAAAREAMARHLTHSAEHLKLRRPFEGSRARP